MDDRFAPPTTTCSAIFLDNNQQSHLPLAHLSARNSHFESPAKLASRWGGVVTLSCLTVANASKKALSCVYDNELVAGGTSLLTELMLLFANGFFVL
jgi:hypothetical protein